MEAKRLEEIRARAELSRKRDWVVPREAIEDIDGLLEHIGELQDLAERGARYRWVPVAERLPDEGKQVIICTTAADVCTGFARWGGLFATEEGCELYLADVTHWMPLPEPEEEEP